MFLFSFLIVLQALSMSLSYDIELKGILKLGDNFHSGLGKGPNNEKMKNSVYVRTKETKDKLPKKFSRSSIMRATSVGNIRTDDLLKYVDHIKTKGVTILKDTGKQITKDIQLQTDLTAHINNVTEEYMMTMQNYSEYIVRKKTEFVIDEEFAFLDMVETACRVIYRDQKKILNRACTLVNNENDVQTMELPVNNSLVPKIQKINQYIFRQNVNTKRLEMRYVCYKFEICRSYPAFTDYIADFIVEIRRLPNNKLETFIKIIHLLMKINEDFFKTICEKEDLEKISEQLAPIFNDVYSIHDSLAVLRALLTQRFKIIHSPDLKLKMRTNGVRILIDIINKAFEYERDDLLAIEFDTNVKAIRKWVADKRVFPESLITRLFSNIIRVLEYNLSKNAKKEISVLMEMIMRGSSKDEEIYKDLFSHGSKYVKGEDFHPDLEII